MMKKNKAQETVETRKKLHTSTYIINNKKTRESFVCKKQQFKQAGITLVALVVTIIVLLILAGVTISLALGDNEIIGKAQYSSNMYANATKNETTMMGEIEENVEILTEDFITTSVKIKDKDGKRIKIENIADYYGHEVTYNGLKYQLFFVDKNGKYSNGEPRIWLQYKEYISGTKLSEHYETTGIQIENSILWQVNPNLNDSYGNEIRKLDSWNTNFKGIAYLCNPDNWNDIYVKNDDLQKGVFAIGGVSAEMFADSYNEANGITPNDEGYFSAKAYKENNKYGYKYKPAHANASADDEGYGYYSNDSKYAVSTKTCNGMYRLTYPIYCAWQSSPSIEGTDRVCVLGSDYGRWGSVNTTYAKACNYRPMVSLPFKCEIELEN
ncbi:MAG: type II secretion system protein [Clostridia bacterium]|nr:type II secretion system protein [Clostridia bacterium]